MTAPLPPGIPAGQTTWASAADVQTITGSTVTANQLTVANGIIEIFSRRICTVAAIHMGVRDIEWLRRAVAYQAVWMLAQPDFFQRLDVSTITEGRKAIVLKEQTLLLAPMSRIALSRLATQRTRSIHVRSPWQDGMSPISSDPDSAGNDFFESWSALAGYGG
jgi:hypothetical protein